MVRKEARLPRNVKEKLCQLMGWKSFAKRGRFEYLLCTGLDNHLSQYRVHFIDERSLHTIDHEGRIDTSATLRETIGNQIP